MGIAPAGDAGAGLFRESMAAPIIPGEGENYLAIGESPVKQVAEAPVSTFSIDVDTGAYANIRRFLMNGQMPPRDAVRVEEMINYFAYDYPGPEAASEPFRVTTAVERTPWNPETYLLQVGIKGFEPPAGARPPANLVFLVDVSGSMADADKL
ncbi:MAG: VWA domain-containing protein, partial [Dongiaceae bacterium]